MPPFVGGRGLVGGCFSALHGMHGASPAQVACEGDASRGLWLHAHGGAVRGVLVVVVVLVVVLVLRCTRPGAGYALQIPNCKPPIVQESDGRDEGGTGEPAWGSKNAPCQDRTDREAGGHARPQHPSAHPDRVPTARPLHLELCNLHPDSAAAESMGLQGASGGAAPACVAFFPPPAGAAAVVLCAPGPSTAPIARLPAPNKPPTHAWQPPQRAQERLPSNHRLVLPAPRPPRAPGVLLVAPSTRRPRP